MKTIILLAKIYSTLAGLLAKLLLKACRNAVIGKKLKIRGIPIIDISPNGKLLIDDNVTLNSTNIDYHINMFGPIKIFIENSAKISIGENTRLHGVCLHARSAITIGKNCLVAANTNIIDCSGHNSSFDEPQKRLNTIGDSIPVEIEDNVWIGTGVLILPGVTIGAGSIVAAGSVVTKKMPSMALIAGNPARVIKSLLPGDFLV